MFGMAMWIWAHPLSNLQKNVFGHVHKYEAVLWISEKLRKTIFCYKMINFSLRDLKFLGKMYFSYTERLASAKVEKVLWLRRNHKEATLLLIYHIYILLLRKAFSRTII